MPQIPSRLPREYESPSPDHRTKYTGVVDTVLRYSNVLHLHQRVCHKIGDTMVRTPRFTTSFNSSITPSAVTAMTVTRRLAVAEWLAFRERAAALWAARMMACKYFTRRDIRVVPYVW